MYNIYFNIAALFIFIVVLFFYFQKKHLPVLQNKVYAAFIFVAFFATLFDIGTAIVPYYAAELSSVWFWAVHVCAYLTLDSIPALYVIYCLCVTDFFQDASKKSKSTIKLLILIPAVINILIVVLSPFSYRYFDYVMAFYIGPENVYYRGKIWFSLLNIIGAYYNSLSIFFLITYRKKINTQKLTFILSYIVIGVAALAVQMLFPQYLVTCFGIALASIMVSSLIQAPEDYIDNTTGAFNRAAFIKMTSYYFSTRKKFLCISVVLDDVVFLSHTFGIEKLNGLQKSVSEYFEDEYPDAEIYFLSNGSFVILMTNYNVHDIEKAVFNLRVRFNHVWNYGGVELKLYARNCVIECPVDCSNTEELLDIIELIMEDTKARRGTVYARNINTSDKKRTAYIAHELKNAMYRNLFEVYYQPIYSTADDCLIGAEALIRLRTENGQYISPEEFIPISEKTGDILRLGLFVFESVCQMLASTDIEEYGIKKIDINLSVAQCMQDVLADQILTIRSIYQIPASIINLEITETAAAYTPDILLKNMDRLAGEGIELSLDDYGSGYSNMNYLLNLPFKMIKIDKNIVWSAFSDKRARMALEATVSMIKKLGMTVLAEGVEDKIQKQILTDMGCDYLQGYYFSKALPQDEFLALMKADGDIREDRSTEDFRFKGLEEI
ncbi:MAG: EAL domain-containing protein [Treponema sp.]|nr:EAL domain-containing protein [Treponema sp.]